MSKLSKYFSLSEFTKSQQAKRLGISNEPTAEHQKNMEELCVNVLDKVREKYGPIFISSGYRSEAVNKKIGGSKTSQHCLGEAADIDMDGLNDDIFLFIKNNLDFDQLIWEFGDSKCPDWVHVSYTNARKNRRQVLVAKSVGGKTVYQPYNA
jgi:zinc D-Ala-D-Ala carboxypeptidase